MGHVAVGVPSGVESRNVETMDGTMERVRFGLSHPATMGDEYPDVFQVGTKFADLIRNAAAANTPVAVVVNFKEKEAGKNGARDVWYWKVMAADEL